MTLASTTQTMNDVTVESDNSDIYENVSADMSFDNMDVEHDGEQPEQKEDAWGDDYDDEETESKKSKEEKLGSEELKLLNDSDGKDKKEVKKKEESEEDEDEEEVKEAKKVEGEEEAKEAPISDAKTNGKKLKVKIGDEYYSLDASGEVTVKIDGKPEKVAIQELINNYSGKTAWDKKFTEIGNEKKVLQQEKQVLESRMTEIKETFGPFVKALKDPLVNPIEAIVSFVEKLDSTGELPYAIEKRLLEANLDALVELSNMSEVEQEAHFLKKQNERLLKSSEKRVKSEQEAQNLNQVRAKVDQIREAYGVSVDQYSDAFEELKSLLPGGNFTHEDVVDWASLKPITPQIEEILKPYVDEISDDDYSGIVTQLGRSLRDGKLSKQQIQKIVKDEFGVSDVVKELNTKLNIGKKKPQANEPEKADSFETFDDLFN